MKGIQVGRDGFDLCAFAGMGASTIVDITTGTNAVFRLQSLHTVNGLPYGSLTEDAHLGIKLHEFGYRSVYVEDRLAVGLGKEDVVYCLIVSSPCNCCKFYAAKKSMGKSE